MQSERKKMRWVAVVGARPNFMKIAPLYRAAAKRPEIDFFMVHTGQHYDNGMSDVFFEDLALPEPDIHLGVGSGTHAAQTGAVMVSFEEAVLEHGADLIVVVGDVNSTLAGALVAAKLRIPLAHVEAGFRSYDMGMPEEINRLLTDAISDFLFSPSEEACSNLAREGIGGERIFLVGDVMIDNLFANAGKAARSGIRESLGVREGRYAVLTIHRAANVDTEASLSTIVDVLREVAKKTDLVFPLHPRTEKMLNRYGLMDDLRGIEGMVISPPLGTLDFQALLSGARLVLTDSGGVQAETSALGVPCLTLRDRTERNETIRLGTNLLVGLDGDRIIMEVDRVLAGKRPAPASIFLWDGKASERIVEILCSRWDGTDRKFVI